MVTRTRHLSPKFIKVKGEDEAETIMAKTDIKIDTDQPVEIDIVDYHIVIYLSTDIIIETGLSIFKITEEILG